MEIINLLFVLVTAVMFVTFSCSKKNSFLVYQKGANVSECKILYLLFEKLKNVQ